MTKTERLSIPVFGKMEIMLNSLSAILNVEPDKLPPTGIVLWAVIALCIKLNITGYDNDEKSVLYSSKN